MLLVHKFKEGKGEEVGAVNHFGTGRLQTIRRETNPVYFEIVNQFNQATGTPVVLNTSFNLRGEPIVSSPTNAYWTYSHSEIDMLVLGNYLLKKER